MLIKSLRDYFVHAPPINLESEEHVERRQARRRTVFLRSTVYPIDVFCDARICDASATGIKGEADVELAIGQVMHVTTDQQTFHAGTVRWVAGRQFGLDLPNALSLFDVDESDVDHGLWEGHHPRAPRVTIDATARLLTGRPPRPATIRNLSSTGMMLDTGPGLQRGQHIIVRSGNAAPVYGRIQWGEDGKVGLRAANRISILAFACHED